MNNKILVRYFKGLGYSFVANPNSSIKVFDVLCEYDQKVKEKLKDAWSGNPKPLKKIGNLSVIFPNPNRDLPIYFEDVINPDYTNKVSEMLNLETSAEYQSTLANALKGEVKGKIIIHNASRTTFEFNDVISNAYPSQGIRAYINEGKLNELYRKEITGNKLYVIWEIAKTNNFSVEYFDDKNMKVGVEIKTQEAKGSTKIMFSNTSESKIKFENPNEMIVFAIKVVQIVYNGTVYIINKSNLKALQTLNIPKECIDTISKLKTDDYEYESKEDLLAILTKAGIDKTTINEHKDKFFLCFGKESFTTKDREDVIHRDKMDCELINEEYGLEIEL